jgi:hypothetical protein
MSTLTAGGGVGPAVLPESFGIEGAAEPGAAALPDAAVPAGAVAPPAADPDPDGAPALGFDCAPAAIEYAASGRARAKTMMT